MLAIRGILTVRGILAIWGQLAVGRGVKNYKVIVMGRISGIGEGISKL
jgi:hypothetical protein